MPRIPGYTLATSGSADWSDAADLVAMITEAATTEEEPMNDGNPQTFCRWTATITYASSMVETLSGFDRFAWALDAADDQLQEACFQRSLATTGDDHVVSVDLRLYDFETDATE